MALQHNLIPLGELRPPTRASAESTPPGRHHPHPQLDDRAWLTRQLAVQGTDRIARQLGVSRARVRRAVIRHGIPAQTSGPRRGSTRTSRTPAVPDATQQALTRVWQRVLQDGDSHRTPPTLHLLITRAQACVQAAANHDPPALRDALEALASIAILCLARTNHAP